MRTEIVFWVFFKEVQRKKVFKIVDMNMERKSSLGYLLKVFLYCSHNWMLIRICLFEWIKQWILWARYAIHWSLLSQSFPLKAMPTCIKAFINLIIFHKSEIRLLWDVENIIDSKSHFGSKNSKKNAILIISCLWQRFKVVISYLHKVQDLKHNKTEHRIGFSRQLNSDILTVGTHWLTSPFPLWPAHSPFNCLCFFKIL